MQHIANASKEMKKGRKSQNVQYFKIHKMKGNSSNRKEILVTGKQFLQQDKLF